MSGRNKPSVRIDWFDGSIIEETRPHTSANFADEDLPENPPQTSKPQQNERKPIGFKRLLDISLLKPPILTLEVSTRPGFWNLFDQEDLKGDFIVLIVRILANICKDIQPGENSKIANLIRSRFLKSKFLERLKSYLRDLPSVRVVEKRMNAQLWDDIESFYFIVLDLCKSVLFFAGKEMNDTVNDLLEVLEISALGVSEEHSERFTKQLFEEINALKVETLVNKDNWESLNTESKSNPDHYKNLNIFPTRSDILGDEHVKIKPNIINGAYPSTEHYIDLQFKLLREDCFGPLREGICGYMKDPSKRRHENIRVYPQVRVLRTYISNNKVGHIVDFGWKDRRNGVDPQEYNKQLMYGSLLLFTSDNFETILCATVLYSNSALSKEGYLVVSFQNPVSQSIFSEPYLMVESEVFFEPYHQVLKVLQNMRIDQLPMKKYIVDVKAELSPPAYLNNDTKYMITNSDILIPVLDTNQWPILNEFNDSQFEAYKFALTREFAVIQGPPGTGKTYIGVKIASTLLKNLSLKGTPMLIICYTNHALDQFLEGILKVTDSIVRLGSQSKSKLLEPYNLSSVRSKIKCKYSYLYTKKRSELESIYKEMTNIQTEIEKCEQNLVTYDTLRPYLKINGKNYKLANGTEDPIINWLFEHLISNKSERKNAVKDTVIQNTDSRIRTCFSEQWALNEIESIKNLMKYVTEIDDNAPNSPVAIKKFDNQIDMIKKRLECYKNYMTLYKNNKDIFEIAKVNDLYELSTDKRWQLYFNCVRELKAEWLNKMDPLLEKHKTTNSELEEVSTLIDSEVMSNTRVVGLTTTAAARRHQLMNKLSSTIVIVEEAAEVLEAHIVASLTRHCQHLILIGDHKQLRPTAAHYKLAKDYNLEISLFERMVVNGLHARTLTMQRRMRPNMAELLVPIIYERLDSHPSVYEYENIRNLSMNLYFYSHEEFEDSEGSEDSSRSHKNIFEAKWCVSFANHLRRVRYKPDEVTILSTYLAQVELIRKLSEKSELLSDIKITSVDNFQGEESRIVILSLVRSNKEGNIGFLAAVNRICVALSRAKEGFFIFGNMKILKSASPIWRAINEKLTAQKAIGNGVVMHCELHKKIRIPTRSPDEFEAFMSANCLTTCLRIKPTEEMETSLFDGFLTTCKEMAPLVNLDHAIIVFSVTILASPEFIKTSTRLKKVPLQNMAIGMII